MNTITQHPYIAFEGVIGVGKTTLARRLSERFQGETLLEAFDENPFLSDFYGDRSRYAFQTQLFFLLSRYRQQQAAPQRLRQRPLLSDYFFEKDKLFAHLNITGGDELEMYDRLYDALSEKVRQPDLVVYLRAETDTLMARIALRDRPYERRMSREYIAALRQGYETLFADYQTTSLLTIETDALDFVRNPDDFDDIENRIRAALTGVHQPALPDISLLATRPAWDLLETARQSPSVSPADAGRAPRANWEALGDFLALAEAVGQIGGVLAQQPPVGPEGSPAAIQTALRNAAQVLTTLARRTGTRLE
ncbi:MAG TPA: deoxynucleoside kinase [Anaerolineae bacterium]|nr:deoxynucleoside kinase [Anaerolineae bacterium]